MKTKGLVLAAVACATLAACGTTRHAWKPFLYRAFAHTQDCNVKDCPVDVTVGINSSTGNCIPAVVEVLNLRPGPAGQRSIVWTITTPGYEFSREDYKFGIFIKSDPFDEFKNVRITDANKKLSLDFANSATGKAYSYALTVRKASGAKEFCDTLDPWLIS